MTTVTKETAKQKKARLKREVKAQQVTHAALPVKMQEFIEKWTTFSGDEIHTDISNFVAMYGCLVFRDIPLAEILESLNAKGEFHDINAISQTLPRIATVAEMKLCIEYALPAITPYTPMRTDDIIDEIDELEEADDYLEILKSLIPHSTAFMKIRIRSLINTAYTMEETPEYLEAVKVLTDRINIKKGVVKELKGGLKKAERLFDPLLELGAVRRSSKSDFDKIDCDAELADMIKELTDTTKAAQILTKFFDVKA